MQVEFYIVYYIAKPYELAVQSAAKNPRIGLCCCLFLKNIRPLVTEESSSQIGHAPGAAVIFSLACGRP